MTPKMVEWGQKNMCSRAVLEAPPTVAHDVGGRMHPQSITLLCAQCGVGFAVAPSSRRRYCSIGCYRMVQGVLPERRCLHCGQPFRAKPSRVASGRGVYCSAACDVATRPARYRTSVWERLAEQWSHMPKPAVGCWEWPGARTLTGYGQLGVTLDVAVYTNLYTHRLAYQQASGVDPGDSEVCHTCDNPPCVRNDEPGTYEVNGISYPRFGHLYLAPHAGNMADMRGKGRGFATR
jgi:hypothetical protein